jgi:RHS repeat-associated protein
LAGNCSTEVSTAPIFVRTGRLLAEYSQGTTYFIHPDHLGSTRLVTAYPSPTIVECDDYYPYGEANVNVGSCLAATNTTYKFTGDERDAETNLDHTQFRQNSSTLGRWMTPDPAGLAAANPTTPQSWNRYAYVLNNPLGNVDPLGLCGEDGVWDCPMVQESDGGGFGGGCTLDGGYIPCNVAGAFLNSGAAAVCPNNFCAGFRNGVYMQVTIDANGAGFHV